MSDDGGGDGIAAGGLAAGAGGLVIVVGATLPWIAFPTSAPSRTGIDLFGPLVPIFGFAVLGGLLAWRWTTPAKFVAAIAGVITLGLGVLVHAGTSGGAPVTPDPATGLFATMGGAAMAAITGSLSILLEDV